MYGEIFEGGEYKNAVAGINDCKFLGFGLNPNGGAGGSALDVIDLHLEVSGMNVKTRWFEVLKEKVYLRDIKDPLTGVERQQTKDEASLEKYKEQQWITKSILTALGVPTTAYNEGMKKVKDFKSYAEMLGNLVPEDAKDKTYECILSYDKKGYLKLPTALWVTGKVLRMKDSEQDELVPSKRVILVKPGEEKEDDTPAETSSWTA